MMFLTERTTDRVIKRHLGYEDVHPDLMMEDALQPGWQGSLVRDEGLAVIARLSDQKATKLALLRRSQ